MGKLLVAMLVKSRVPLELVHRVTDQFLKTAPLGEEVGRTLRLHFHRDTVNRTIDLIAGLR